MKSLERQPNPEKEDSFLKAELQIEKPHRDKSFMISFKAENKTQSGVYRAAITDVCNQHKLKPFYQSGSHEAVGYQAYELWAETNQQDLENLIPGIHEKAQEIYQRWQE